MVLTLQNRTPMQRKLGFTKVRAFLTALFASGVAIYPATALADPPPPPSDSPAAPPSPAPSTTPAPALLPAAAPSAPIIAPAKPVIVHPPDDGQHFSLDPLYDGVIIGSSAAFSTVLGVVIATGELKPTAPGPISNLLPIDRIAVTQTIDPHAALYSDIGLTLAISYAVLDPILSGTRDGLDALLVDAMMYAESGAVTVALSDLTKIAVRRPRPIDYINCSTAIAVKTCANTDIELSFYSGHAAGVSAISATATYLAFVRSPHTWRPWATLAGGILLTSFVSVERVRAGAHFPTDVIMGSIAGTSVGLLVPHLHRHKKEPPSVWIGLAPARVGEGGSVTLQGIF